MTITNGYCTLDDFKNRLAGSMAVDATRDALMEQTIEAASRQIDGWCGRRFYAASETRYVTAVDWDLCFVDDLLSVSALATDDDNDRTYSTTWAATDYELEPVNAPYTIPPSPYSLIRTTPDGDYSFPSVRRGVKITGSWGFSSTAPHDIREACLLLAARLWKRKDAVLGVAGRGQLGEIVSQIPKDDDIWALLRPYSRVTMW